MRHLHVAIAMMAAALPAATAPPARADSVLMTSGLRYDGVMVDGAGDGVVQFRVHRRLIAKPLDKVAAIEMASDPQLTAAEAAAREGKTNLAISAYRDALKAARLSWKRTLIHYRLMRAAEAGGQIDLAVQTWLEVVDAAGATGGVLASRPRKLPVRGDARNAKAIALLEAKAKKVQAAAYLRTLRRLLSDLYEREGRLKEAQAVIGKPDEQVASAPSSAGQAPALSQPAGKDRLRLARLALKSGDFPEAIAELKPVLKTLAASDLPAALYLLGKAQSALADKQVDPKSARDLRIEAGLNLMRVVALFIDDENVPDALFEAGRINQALANDVAARAAWQEVVARHKNTPAAGKAAKALAKLDGPEK